MVAIMSVKVV